MDIDFIELDSLADTDCKAVIVAANIDLWISSRMAQDLIVYGGDEIEMEAMAQGPVALGESIATSGGRLKNIQLIVHSVIYGDAFWYPTAASIEKGTFSALALTNDYKVNSVALPILGEVHRNCTLEQIAAAMWNGLSRFLKDYPTPEIQELKFVIENEDLLDQFFEAFADAQAKSSQAVEG